MVFSNFIKFHPRENWTPGSCFSEFREAQELSKADDVYMAAKAHRGHVGLEEKG